MVRFSFLGVHSFLTICQSLHVNRVRLITSRAHVTDVRSYIPPVQINETMRGQVIGVVKASKSSKFPVGSIATGTTGWAELAIANEKHLEKVILPKNGRLTDALSVLGKSLHGLRIPFSPRLGLIF
jgi:hypothetical protein